MRKPARKPVSLRFGDAIAEPVHAIAHQTGEPLSVVIRQLIRLGLQQMRPEVELRKRNDRG